MSEKAKALGLVLLLMGAILVGQFWASTALTFLVHVAFMIVLEIAVSRFSGRGRGPGAKE